MLKELRLQNFKSFTDEQTISFAPVTVFVGANGSGKSNALDAIRFLQSFSHGLDVIDILTGKWQGGREVHPAIRRGPAEICWDKTTSFTIATEVEVHSQLSHHIKQNKETGERSLTITEAPLQGSTASLSHCVEVSLGGPPLPASRLLPPLLKSP